LFALNRFQRNWSSSPFWSLPWHFMPPLLKDFKDVNFDLISVPKMKLYMPI
jgi:hypothetical protein